MTIYTSDLNKSVDVGTGSFWFCMYSTAMVKLTAEVRGNLPLALAFLDSGECSAKNAKMTAVQMGMLRNYFAAIPPEDAVYDMHNPRRKVPWKQNISPNITSCANLFKTANGLDLFTEVIGLLNWAAANNQNLFAT